MAKANATQPPNPASSPMKAPPSSPPQSNPPPQAPPPSSQANPPPQASSPAPQASRPQASPPPPQATRRPHRASPPPQAPPPQASAPLESRPVLSKDPAEREKQLATVRDEASTVLALLAMIVDRLTPTMPLSTGEKEAISAPLEQVLFKYGGAIPCEWQLAITLGFVALPRVAEVKRIKKEKGAELK